MARVIEAQRDRNLSPGPFARGRIETTKPVRNSPGMPRSIHCLHCGVSLTLPPQADGRRVKCPKCGGRFLVGSAGDAPPAGTPNGPDPNSTLLLSKASSAELSVMPVAAGDLRETFNLPMMTEEVTAAPRSKDHASVPNDPGDHEVADALSLFQDQPAAPRRKKGAEARAASRRCPTCGGVVAVGMSICQTCGLDLETGVRVGLDDDLAPPPPSRQVGLPLPILIIGGLGCAASAALVVLAILLWHGGTSGAQYFIPVAGFGIYASVQFLRAKSVRLILIALTIGAVIDFVALIALPIYVSQSDIQIVERKGPAEDPNDADFAIRNPAELLDTNKLSTGIAVLALYAGVSIYLLSPQVQKHYHR